MSVLDDIHIFCLAQLSCKAPVSVLKLMNLDFEEVIFLPTVFTLANRQNPMKVWGRSKR